jgi:TatD DNase family protein
VPIVNYSLIDTHAHLDFPEFAADVAEVVQRADAAGVTRIITIGTGIKSSMEAVKIAERFPGVFAAVGLHPNSAFEQKTEFIDDLRALAKHPKVVAIGETGLDYHYLPSKQQKDDIVETALGSTTGSSLQLEIEDEAVKAAQAAAFEQQLELAAELHKNVIIHQRDAWSDTLEILRSTNVRGVFHCFNSSLAEAQEILRLGHMVSFTGLVTFKNAAETREVAATTPTDRIMVETDCPFLAPTPFRGRRCEPAYVREIAQALAESRKMPINDFAEQTTRNACEFFHLEY